MHACEETIAFRFRGVRAISLPVPLASEMGQLHPKWTLASDVFSFDAEYGIYYRYKYYRPLDLLDRQTNQLKPSTNL